jgi:hypothetical protein
MLKLFIRALPLAILGVVGTTQSALAAFDPTPDELSIGTFLLALGLMIFLAVVYAVVDILGLNRPGEVEIPDHAHDHRYAGHH